MPALIPLIIKNWRLIVAVLSILSLLGGFFAFRAHYIGIGEKRATLACESEKQQVINDNTEIRKHQDGVVRLGSTSIINSMRDGTF